MSWHLLPRSHTLQYSSFETLSRHHLLLEQWTPVTTTRASSFSSSCDGFRTIRCGCCRCRGSDAVDAVVAVAVVDGSGGGGGIRMGIGECAEEGSLQRRASFEKRGVEIHDDSQGFVHTRVTAILLYRFQPPDVGHRQQQLSIHFDAACAALMAVVAPDNLENDALGVLVLLIGLLDQSFRHRGDGCIKIPSSNVIFCNDSLQVAALVFTQGPGSSGASQVAFHRRTGRKR